jgi:hypothetical protein
MSTNLVDKYTHAGVMVTLLYDPDPEHANPRDADNLSEMCISYRGYTLGDHQLPASGLPTISCPQCDGDGYRHDDDCERCVGTGQIEPTLREWFSSKEAIAAMPLFVYEHSGLSISGGRLVMLEDDEIASGHTSSSGRFALDSAGWDTSFVGFMIASEASIERLCGSARKYRDPAWLAEAFKSEIEEYDRFLRGEVLGYIVAEGSTFEDSCWGFVGIEHARHEATAAAEVVAKQLSEEESERLAWAARDVETVGV